MKIPLISDCLRGWNLTPHERYIKGVQADLQALKAEQIKLVHMRSTVEAQIQANDAKIHILEQNTLPEMHRIAGELKATGGNA